MERRNFVNAMLLGGAASTLASAASTTAQAAEGGDSFDDISIKDRLQIMDEITRYSWALDSGIMEDYLDRYWEDGVLLHPKPDGSPGRMEGHDAIRDWIGPNFAQRPTQTYGHQHQFSATRMTRLDSGDVKVDAYITIFRHEFHRQYWPSGPSWRMGTWHTIYSKRKGLWKIREVDVQMWTDTSLGTNGTAIADRPPHMPGTR